MNRSMKTPSQENGPVVCFFSSAPDCCHHQSTYECRLSNLWDKAAPFLIQSVMHFTASRNRDLRSCLPPLFGRGTKIAVIYILINAFYLWTKLTFHILRNIATYIFKSNRNNIKRVYLQCISPPFKIYFLHKTTVAKENKFNSLIFIP